MDSGGQERPLTLPLISGTDANGGPQTPDTELRDPDRRFESARRLQLVGKELTIPRSAVIRIAVLEYLKKRPKV